MIQYVVFNKLTGSPEKWGQCQEELLHLQAGPNEVALATSELGVEGNRPIIRREVKNHRDALLLAGAPTQFGRVDVDPISTGKIMGLTLRAIVAQQRGEEVLHRNFTFFDDAELTLDAEQLIDLAVETEAYVNACHNRARALIAQINEAANMAELLAIDVRAGWPED